jgi:hypothetical protein
MKDFDSRTYSLSDFLEWHEREELVLNPRFQRRPVWSDKARSYFMDTIIRGKPIPKVFIRQIIDPQTRKSVREVVDGQQRLRAILDYINDGFQIRKSHNPKYAKLYFSQLDPETQTSILSYEVSVDLLINMPDSDVLDIFRRLNSYAVVLSPQETISSTHFGPFRVLAEGIANRYNEFWTTSGIVSDHQVLRMMDVELTSDLLIAMLNGVRSKKQIRGYYDQYEKQEEISAFSNGIEDQFSHVMDLIVSLLGTSLAGSVFGRIPIFYSLFTALYHLEYGLPGLDAKQHPIPETALSRVRSCLGAVESIFHVENKRQLDADQLQFLEDARLATTDAAVRTRRTSYLVGRLLSGLENVSSGSDSD